MGVVIVLHWAFVPRAKKFYWTKGELCMSRMLLIKAIIFSTILLFLLSLPFMLLNALLGFDMSIYQMVSALFVNH